ncbi:MAG TPA: hypothetical protein VGF59_06590 [Bryobacteraceae bacterium]|jgi:hypothetical protein
MTALALTAITDFALGAEGLALGWLLARRPKDRDSAAWFWSAVMLLAGLGAVLGGIDHGIFEPAGLPRYWIQRSTWIAVGVMTFCVLLTTSRQFFPARWQTVALAIGAVQFAGSTIAEILIDDFRIVILNYAPVMLLLLALSIVGLRRGIGSLAMIAGIAIQFAASAIQASGFDALAPLDHNGLYHLLSMIGMVFLYAAGKKLRVK